MPECMSRLMERRMSWRCWPASSLVVALLCSALLAPDALGAPTIAITSLPPFGVSGSMQGTVSGRSTMSRVEVAAVMAMATAKRAANVDVVIYGDTNARVDRLAGMSVLGGVQKVVQSIGSVGHSTFGHTAIARWFDAKRHQRVVIFTDDQQHDSGRVRLDHVPVIYTFNLAGYRPSALPSGERGRYTIGGFTDATFTVMKVIEDGRNAAWPF